MIERIDSLLGDWRLEYLGYEREFSGIRYKLTKMRARLFAGGSLKRGEKKYISQAEKHIQNIMPHTKKIMVNDELQDVEFITKTDDD